MEIYSILLKFHHGKKIITMEFVTGNNKIPQWKQDCLKWETIKYHNGKCSQCTWN